jgi:arylsulfatase A-like enzyme
VLKISRVCLVVSLAIFGCGRGDGTVEQARNLVDLFPLARVHVESSEIDLGTAEARPQMVFGWGHDEGTKDQRTFVWAMGERSELEVFSGPPRDVNLRVSGWGLPVKTLPRQEITVSVNGYEVGSVEMSRGPKAGFEVEVAAEDWRHGPNLLAFEYSYNERLIDVAPNRKDTRPLALAWDRVVFDGFENAARPSVDTNDDLPVLSLPFNSQVDYFLELVPGSSLFIDEVIPLGGDAQFEQGRLQIELAMDGGIPQLWEITVGAATGDPLVIPLDIPGPGPGKARLSLRAEPVDGNSATGIGLLKPMVRSPIVQEHTIEKTMDMDPARRPNIIVYLIDTLRADHLGCYGYQLPVSPRIDAFAADSILFEKAYSQCSWTRPAVASMFTGVYPQVHGTNAVEDSLPTDLPTIAELLKSAGYETAAVSTNSIAGPKWGFSRGFDRFQLLKERLKTVEVHRQSDAAHEVVFRWFRERPLRDPFFLFVHTTDPHGPYTPREPYRSRFASEVEDPGVGHWDRVKALKNLRNDEVDTPLIDDLTALYDAEIAFNDANFGTLIDRLKSEGIYDSSMIILFSDHGEEFFDHGRWMHGWSLYQEQLHVPMIIKMPAGLNAGYRSREVIELVDLLPTILEYAGLSELTGVQGRSVLTDLLHRRSDREFREAYAYLARSKPRHLEAYIRGDTKLILNRAMDLPRAAVEVFDLATDGGEASNLAETHPVLAGFMTASFRSTTSRWEIRDLGSDELTQEQRERLKALGYID